MRVRNPGTGDSWLGMVSPERPVFSLVTVRVLLVSVSHDEGLARREEVKILRREYE